MIVVCGTVGSFGAWCVADVGLVRFAPPGIRQFDWLGILLPVIVAWVGAVILRDLPIAQRLGLSAGAALLVVIACVLLILFIGVDSHIWIGGDL